MLESKRLSSFCKRLEAFVKAFVGVIEFFPSGGHFRVILQFADFEPDWVIGLPVAPWGLRVVGGMPWAILGRCVEFYA